MRSRNGSPGGKETEIKKIKNEGGHNGIRILNGNNLTYRLSKNQMAFRWYSLNYALVISL